MIKEFETKKHINEDRYQADSDEPWPPQDTDQYAEQGPPVEPQPENNQFEENSRGERTNIPRITKPIYFRSQYHKNYKIDESALKQILKRHVFQISIKLDLIIYYKSKKVSDLLIKNNISACNVPKNEKSHVVYKFTCNLGECSSLQNENSYIGLTTMTVKKRMSAHRYQGSIFKHCRNKHGVSPNIDNLLESSEILYHEGDQFQLHVYEALHIRKFRPPLNENNDDFTCLKLNIY